LTDWLIATLLSPTNHWSSIILSPALRVKLTVPTQLNIGSSFYLIISDWEIWCFCIFCWRVVLSCFYQYGRYWWFSTCKVHM